MIYFLELEEMQYREKEPTKPKAEKEGSQRQGRKEKGLLSDFTFCP